MVELTDSQKILLQPIAAALGCAADPQTVLEVAKELKATSNTFKRGLFVALSRIPPSWIDDVVNLLMSRVPKK